jgi:putative aldouronate transport system permease protein
MRLAATLSALLLILCFGLPFRSVSLGMNSTLSVPGYAMLLGFTFTSDGADIAIPPQVSYIIGITGALLFLLWSVINLFSADRTGRAGKVGRMGRPGTSGKVVRTGKIGSESIAAITGLVCMAGFLGQVLLEPGAYASNNALPKIVRDLFISPRGPAAGAAAFFCLLLGIYGIVLFLSSPRGIRWWERVLVRKINSGAIFLSAVALIAFISPLKQIDLGKGERLVVYGFSLLTGTSVSSGGVTASIPPQVFMVAFFALTVGTIILSLVKLPKKLCWLMVAFPVLAATSIFGQMLYEMFVYNTNTALPGFVRQMLSGKYTMPAYLAVGTILVAAVAGLLATIMETNKDISRRILDHTTLYIFMLPGIVLFLLFNYLPMFGVVMAFQQFDPVSGFLKSEWVGLHNFVEIFKLPAFLLAFRNTLIIATIRLVIEFPTPIIFALLLNELRVRKFKRTVQSVSYLPNFMSWVIVAGIWYQMLSPESGIVNQALLALNVIKEPIFFMQTKNLFYPVLIFTSIWKNLGFASILYMASIAGIDQEQYEAAVMDGAGRLRQMRHITLPGMKSTIVLLFILAVAGLLNAGFDQLWTMGNPAVRDISEILDTLVLRYLTRGNFKDLSLGAAMGMFKAVVGLILFFVANLVSRKLNQDSLI